MQRMKVGRLVFLAAGVLTAFAVRATTYYWLVGEPGAHEWGDATDLNNWSTVFDTTTRQPVATSHPTRLPTSSDTICGYRSLMLDLKGTTLTTGSLNCNATSPYTGVEFWGSSDVFWHVTNGTLSVDYALMRHSTAGDGLQVWNGGAFVCRKDMSPGNNTTSKTPVWIHPGGLVNVKGKLSLFSTMLTVEPGGTFETSGFSMSPYSYSPNCMNVITNRGSANFPNGISVDDGRAAGNANWGRLKVYQLDGVMTLGGPVTHNDNRLWLDFYLEGGTLRATGDVTFTNTTIKTVAANAVVTADVAKASAKLDMGDFDYGDNVTVVKRGPGNLAFDGAGNQPAALVVEEGALIVDRPDFVLPASTRFAAGAGICFAAKGVTFGALDLPASGLVCPLDLLKVGEGDVIAISEFAETREAICAGVNAWCAAQAVGLRAAASGDSVVLSLYAEHVFDATSGKTLDDPSGWGEASVPAGCDVDIAGAGVVTLGADAPSFGVIRVRDGAELRLTGGTAANYVTAPAVSLYGNAKLTVPGGAYVAFTNNVVTATRGEDLPIFEVATNAHVYATGDVEFYERSVSGGTASGFRSWIRFTDVDLRLFGEIMTPVAAETQIDGAKCGQVHVYFGTATAGQTARFRFSGIGGRLYLRNYSWGYNAGYFYVACPEAGGCVTADRPLVFRDFSFPIYPGDRSYNRVTMGVNNPESEVVRVEAENTVFDDTDTSEISGGVDLLLGRGATFSKRGNRYFLNSVKFSITGAAKVTFEDTEFSYPRSGVGSDNAVKPTVGGVESLTLRRSVYRCWTWTGNGKGVITLDDATWRVCDFMPNNTTKPYVYGTPPSPVFNGYGEARIAGGTFRLEGENNALGQGGYGQLEWDRTIDFAHDVPITGTGNLLVSNLAPTNTMTATIVCGANTCTGTAGAEAGTRSTLCFADGANWAGTVVANGCVKLFSADPQGVEVPAAVSFGAIRLDGDFPVRLWKDGDMSTNDVVNLAGAVTGAGRIVGVPMAGYEPQLGDAFAIGLYPADAALPQGRGRWTVEAEPTDDPSVVRLILKCWQKGMMLIVR